MKTRPADEREPRRPSEGAPPPDATRRRHAPKQPPDDPDAPARYEDPVDEASAESMIASDPPARSGVRLGPAKRKRSP